ncbi:MAG: hypothetical protein JSS86_20790 [Cyanobacteria bacterium SZAS LIN-2]|nr:hypothetical protein [Cyanobacteria bacterium SZAS LIN-2]MBS2007387.1 hypothetical protein [Cyanobacteria bacterium SZAS TMP-1]
MSEESWGKLWRPYIDTAIGAWDRGDKTRADKIVDLLLLVLKQGRQYSTVDENLVHGLYSVADHFSVDREYSRAEWIYLKILESQEEILGPDAPESLDTLLRLSRVVRACGACFETTTADDLPSAH